MAKKQADMKSQLEAIVGEKLTDEAAALIRLVQTVASTTVSNGSTTERSLIIARPNRCHDCRLLDVGGVASTDSNGKRILLLKSFMCPVDELFTHPIIVVATPLSDSPRYITVLHSLLNNGADVEMRFATWDATGAPAPNVAFNFRCRVELTQIIL